MNTVLLKYFDDGGMVQKMQMPFRSLRGFDTPEIIRPFPNRVITAFDGSKRTEFKGFRRVPVIDFGVLNDAGAILFLHAFFIANVRSMYLGGTAGKEEEIILSTEQDGLESQWKNDCELGKNFTMQFVENAIRKTWPDYTQAAEYDIMYIKSGVEVTGTEASPEPFKTNYGKLATMETGQPYPEISLLSWVVSVICTNPVIKPVEDSIANDGTNITFQLAVQNAGNPSPDGKFYTDIIIGLQPRP